MPRGIDHLVLASHDLDAQVALYRSLGFQVGARNRHAWGTLNHIVQFPGCFLELITTESAFERPAAGTAVAQFTDPIVDTLAVREGMSQLVLESRDAAADLAEFGRHGIAGRETFFFERRGKRPDGSDVRVAFTLAFARNPAMSGTGFFVCQQHYPEAFWNPAFQSHPNGVTGIAAVVMVSPVPRESANFITRFAGADVAVPIAGGFAVETGRGRVEVLAPDAANTQIGAKCLPQGLTGAHFAAIRFNGGALGGVGKRAHAASNTVAEAPGRTTIPASAAFGVALVFAG